jgi:hypothetical protein
MGRTVPSYRLASERERRKWKIFREELDRSERKDFDEMIATAWNGIEPYSITIRSVGT